MSLMRMTLLRSTLLAASALAAGAASAQYYYGPPPAPYAYNAPPPMVGYGPPPPMYGGYYDEAPRPGPRPISARTVVNHLQAMGYRQVGRPRFTGSLYIVQATAPDGMRQEVTVDAIRGMILNRVVIAGPSPDRWGPEPSVERPRRQPPRREAARQPAETRDPVEVDRPASSGGPGLPPPADPRLDPSAEPRQPRATRPPERRTPDREAKAEPPRSSKPADTPRPYAIDPAPAAPAAPAPKPAAKPSAPPATTTPATTTPPASTADSQPRSDRPVRVIQGVTPMAGNQINGEAGGSDLSQLDSLPQPPSPAPPTGE
ncbi:hypothetical protein [Enterovirga rhinocerotis]|uniref:Uncharacterized protein n=1 Tax=Enterovirga rhinocerotis TaxID=1339210 RepID=A0A4R7C639_9HYPH|nr:hypothetical protein [Enterovirga rhinocerotis]TDR93868.1 hypothetical protein EV668_1137 [Enterovirga rhinocerotis]